MERAFLDPGLGPFLVRHHPGLREAWNRVEQDDGRRVRGVLTLEAEPRAYGVAGRTVWTRRGRLACRWHYDRELAEGHFVSRPNIPTALAALFTNRGTMRLVDEGGQTRRIFQVEVHVRLPVVGLLAERAVLRGGLEMMDQEAALLTRFLAERAPQGRGSSPPGVPGSTANAATGWETPTLGPEQNPETGQGA